MKAYYIRASKGSYEDYYTWIVKDTVYEDEAEAEKICEEYNQSIQPENIKKQFKGISYEDFERKISNQDYDEVEVKTDVFQNNYDLYIKINYEKYQEAEVIEVEFKPKIK